MSPEVDADALEMAHVLLTLISPTGPSDRDRKAIQAFGAMSAVLDSAGTKMKEFTTRRNGMCGRTRWCSTRGAATCRT
ncbi:hypothetical protein MOQ72_22640 [Saccharopolyspora sp. K220]|uniref:hypothetical protein n=1 Tax=Saccharopolyspora soli TaxID=2926618 RepID=UPI001F56A885|nr:hypothetical protein [Saccharopolyspora soli]MCI2420245.1 hypothetical protein [Saccharopolyspora soli]